MLKKWRIYGVVVMGMLFTGIYTLYAAPNIIYSDYIRLVITYLPGVYSKEMFLVPDVLTRIPVTYLARMINTFLFGYDTRFDMMLGVLGVGIGGIALWTYCYEHQLKVRWRIALFIIYFSLNQWEMLTNGTGWVHFWAIALFYYTYMILDRVWRDKANSSDKVLMIVLPVITILGFAGEYCAAYALAVFAGDAFALFYRYKYSKQINGYFIYQMITTLIAFGVYFISRSTYQSVGGSGAGIVMNFLLDPIYFISFYANAHASMFIGAEVAETLDSWLVFAIGFLVMGLYYLAFWLNYRYVLYTKSMMPILLLVYGKLNHLCILAARWGFYRIDYGMSSRYAIQYQAGMIGILLTLALAYLQKHRNIMKMICGLGLVFILAGNLYTTWDEIKKAPYRREYANYLIELAENLEEVENDTLGVYFQYRNGQAVREALNILNDNSWNVYKNK